MKTLEEAFVELKKVRDILNEVQSTSPLVRSALCHIDEAIDDIEDKLASNKRMAERVIENRMAENGVDPKAG